MPEKYKNGVVRSGEVFYNGSWHKVSLSPEIILAEQKVRVVYQRNGYVCVVTCGIEGLHSDASLHPQGKALDFRIWGVKDVDALRDEIKAELGKDYDVINEGTHIHVEYDPKG